MTNPLNEHHPQEQKGKTDMAQHFGGEQARMTQVTETLSRKALIATASNYRSVAEAIMELVDNPFDYRYGRYLTVNVDIQKRQDFVRVSDFGGEGMDDSAIADWIRWGEGHLHGSSDIGQYHVGGKSAAIYLAESLEIVCRKHGDDAVWRFYDPHWGSRDTPLTAEISKVRDATCHLSGPLPPDGQGFVQITLRGLKSHRYEPGILRQRLADTYRTLIDEGDCTIRVNGTELHTESMPWSSSIREVTIGPETLSGGLRIRGRVGAVDKDQLSNGRGVRFRHGIRTEYNKRKITDGEQFRHNLSGRGALMRLYGEVSILGGNLQPNQLKNGWPYDSDAWQVLERRMHEHMKSVVRQLNETADAKPVSRQERKRANNARRRVEHALQKLKQLDSLTYKGSIPSGTGPGGRRPPAIQSATRENQPTGRTRSPATNRTPPPANPIGRLLRKIGGMPPVHLDGLGDHTARTEWRQDDNHLAVVVNTDYPLYKSLGSNEDYIFESLVMHILSDDKELLPTTEAQRLFDQIVWLDLDRAEGRE